MWEDVVPESENVLEFAAVVNHNMMALAYLQDVKSVVGVGLGRNEQHAALAWLTPVSSPLNSPPSQLYKLETGELIQNFPLEVGHIVSFTGRRKESGTTGLWLWHCPPGAHPPPLPSLAEIFFKLVSFLIPGNIYHVDLTSDKLEVCCCLQPRNPRL